MPVAGNATDLARHAVGATAEIQHTTNSRATMSQFSGGFPASESPLPRSSHNGTAVPDLGSLVTRTPPPSRTPRGRGSQAVTETQHVVPLQRITAGQGSATGTSYGAKVFAPVSPETPLVTPRWIARDSVPSTPSAGSGNPSAGRPVAADPAVQRSSTDMTNAPAGVLGVPITVRRSATPDVPAPGRLRGDGEAPTATTLQEIERRNLDELARRLLDPVVRLLRAELRHGREGVGRLRERRR